MSEIFLKIINMSISASYIVLAVMLLRLLLKKAPKWITVVLWGIVAVRLVCPFSIESVLSLIPSSEVVSPDIMMDKTPEINTGIPIINQVINPVISGSFTPDPGTSANPLQLWIPTFAVIWIIGMVALLVYTVISYAKVKRKIGTAVLLRDNIYQSENVVSPFVLGIIKPKIYLPFNMNEKDMEHVVAHEMAHIRRKDHLWKPLGFLLLTLHWFNPLMWLGYVLLCRDIELACDEKVIKELDHDARADYSQALLTCSVNRRMIAACPLAFGEVGIKDRVKSVLSYKKPAFWIIIVAVLACIVLAVCFLTNPPAKEVNLEFPFEIEDVENIEMYHYVGTPGQVEKKLIVSEQDIKTLYEKFESIAYKLKKADEVAGGETTSFRFNLSDGTMYELIYRGYGVKNGILKSPTGDFMYFTSADIGWNWRWLNEDLVAVEVDKSELPGNDINLGASNLIYGFIPSPSESDKISYIYIRDFGCDVKDATINFEKARFEDGNLIFDIHWTNEGSANVDIGPDFEVYKYNGSKLEKLEHKGVWNYYREMLAGKGMNVDSDATAVTFTYETTTSYNLYAHYDVLTPGSYLFKAHGAWVEFSIIDPASSLLKPYSITATFDIDGDGVDENCTLRPGHTSGLFTFIFSVQDKETGEVKYETEINSQVYELSFQKGADGITRVQGITQDEPPETHLFDISIKDGYVYLTENGVYIGEIN